MDTDTPIRLDRNGAIATLTLCRPAQKNVMTHAFCAALQAHADALHADPALRCVLLQAEGPMFCAGADVKEMATHADALPAWIDSLITPAHQALLRLVSLPVPVVGLLRGTAAGGGASLALACDVLVAARSARIVIAYPQLGTTPDCGLSHALIDKLGPQRALQLFLLSDGIDMVQATKLGLVAEVADDDQAEQAAHAVAERLARLPSVAAKRLFLHDGLALLRQRLDRERESFLQCAGTPQFRERALSFARPRHG